MRYDNQPSELKPRLLVNNTESIAPYDDVARDEVRTMKLLIDYYYIFDVSEKC